MSVCRELVCFEIRSLCDRPITRPEESSRLWCVVVFNLESSRIRRLWPALGRSARGGQGGRHTFTGLHPYVNCYSTLMTLVHDYTYYLTWHLPIEYLCLFLLSLFVLNVLPCCVQMLLEVHNAYSLARIAEISRFSLSIHNFVTDYCMSDGCISGP